MKRAAVRIATSAALLVLIATLAGCAHGEGWGTTTVPRPEATKSNAQNIVVSIRVPAKRTTSADQRRPLYISSSTKSVAFSVNAGPPTIVNVVTGSPGCTTNAQGDITCTFSVSAPPGTDTFEETLYDQLQPPGATAPTGNALSHVKQIAVIKVGQSNAIGLTLHGIVASVTLQLPASFTLVQGTTTTLPLSISAQDADGNTIIADPYDSPIALASSNDSVTLSSSAAASPSDGVTLTYHGGVTPPVTISASAAAGSGRTLPRVAVIVPAPKTPNSTDWTTFGFDAQRSGYNPSETRIDRAAAASGLTLKWSAKIPGATYADTQPLVVTNVPVNGAYDDLVIVGDERGGLTAFNAADGTVVWRNTYPGALRLSCHDIPDGWFGVTGTPAVDRAQNRVYVVGGGGNMYAVDLSSGTTLTGWGPASVVTDPAHDHVYSAVAFDSKNHRAFVATASYCDNVPAAEGARAVDTASGTVVAGPLYFTKPTATTLSGGIWGPGGFSLDPRGNGYLYGAIGNASDTSGIADAIVRVTSAMQLDAYNIPPTGLADADFGSSPLVYQDGGACLVAEQKTGTLFVYNADAIAAGPIQAITIGAATSDGTNLGTAAYANHIVYVATSSSGPYGQGMLAFDVRPGCTLAFRWAQALTVPASEAPGNAPYAPPTVANGVVYAGDGLGQSVYALDALTGAKLWTRNLAAPVFTAPTVANGRLYALSFSATLYAFGP